MGYHAGMLLLLMQIFRRMGSETPDLAQEAEHRVDQLRGSTFRSTPVEMREELTGQIPLTLDSRWGHLDGLEVIARSLEGELNIAPQAIRDGLMKQKVREDERRTMEIHFSSLTRQTRSTEEKEGEEIPYDPKDPRQGHDPKDPKGGPQDKAHWRGLLKRMRNHPRPQRLLDAVLEGDKTQREIAERYGVTDRTVRSWITEAKQLLEED